MRRVTFHGGIVRDEGEFGQPWLRQAHTPELCRPRAEGLAVSVRGRREAPPKGATFEWIVVSFMPTARLSPSVALLCVEDENLLGLSLLGSDTLTQFFYGGKGQRVKLTHGPGGQIRPATLPTKLGFTPSADRNHLRMLAMWTVRIQRHNKYSLNRRLPSSRRTRPVSGPSRQEGRPAG